MAAIATGGLAVMATGTAGGGGGAIATGAMPNGPGGTNWLEAICCCIKVSGNVAICLLNRQLFSRQANNRQSAFPRRRFPRTLTADWTPYQPISPPLIRTTTGRRRAAARR